MMYCQNQECLHHAVSAEFEVKREEETVPCAKCGTQVPADEAFEDEGEGDEAGKTFYYCSKDCMETH